MRQGSKSFAWAATTEIPVHFSIWHFNDRVTCTMIMLPPRAQHKCGAWLQKRKSYCVFVSNSHPPTNGRLFGMWSGADNPLQASICGRNKMSSAFAIDTRNELGGCCQVHKNWCDLKSTAPRVHHTHTHPHKHTSAKCVLERRWYVLRAAL